MLVAHELLPQWTCAAFHDAGTFDKNVNAGGANGCPLNQYSMRLLLPPPPKPLEHKEEIPILRHLLEGDVLLRGIDIATSMP